MQDYRKPFNANRLRLRHGRCFRARQPQPGSSMISARRILSVALLVAAASCAEQEATAPVQGASAQRSILASPTAVQVVTRNTALSTPLSSSVVIGVFGGRITIPGAGLSVVVPPGAVLSPTRFTATA